jgi:hypothetical protein
VIVSLHPLAERELNDAAQYYEMESQGLGAAFLGQVERCCAWVVEHPEPDRAGVTPTADADLADALRQREQVVVPVAIRVGAHVARAAVMEARPLRQPIADQRRLAVQ